MKKFLLLFLFIAWLFFNGSTITFAQENATYDSRNSYTIRKTDNSNLPFTQINDSLPALNILFHGCYVNTCRTGSTYVCLEPDFCIDNDALRKGISSGAAEDTSKAMSGLGVGDIRDKTMRKYSLTTDNITVCGDGPQKLKTSCGSGDYFHGGSIYIFSVWVEVENRFYLKTIGGFPVNHTYPGGEVLDTATGNWEAVAPGFFVLPGNTSPPFSYGVDAAYGCQTTYFRPLCLPWRINFTSWQILPGGDPDRRNNYKLEIKGPVSMEKCFVPAVTGSRREAVLQFPEAGRSYYEDGTEFTNFAGGLPTGIYTVELKEWVNDGAAGAITSAAGGAITGGVFGAVNTVRNRCDGGFTYYRIICRVTNAPFKPPIENQSCTDYRNYNLITDPNHVDFASAVKLQGLLGQGGPGSDLPCGPPGSSNATVKDPVTCTEMNTALGNFPTDIPGFVSTLFSYMLTIGGFITTVRIVYAGYQLLTSRGDKERIQEAREKITASILGLLFIVLSLFLLSLIGAGILKLPGFG